MLNLIAAWLRLLAGIPNAMQPRWQYTRRMAGWVGACLIVLVGFGGWGDSCIAAVSLQPADVIAPVDFRPADFRPVDFRQVDTGTSDFSSGDVGTDSLNARELCESAFSNRYVDEPDFPGYEAEVSVTYNRQIYQGRVRVTPDYRIEIYNMAREDARNYAIEQLTQAHAQHQPAPFAALHNDSDFRLVGSGPSGGVDIEEHGPMIDASYRIQNNRIVEVTRHIGDFDVTVTTLATIQPAAGYLPTEYREVVRDRTTNEVISAREYRDYYMKVSKYFLLHRRLMREADSLELLRGKPVDETAIIITGIDAIPTAAQSMRL